MLIFSVYLGWFPVGLAVPVGTMAHDVTLGDWLIRLILPAFTLSIVGIASIALYTRDRLVNILNSDYFIFARARGENHWSIILRHGIRNVLLPAITLQFMSFSELFGGAVLVEQIFSYPGIGQATVAAGLRSDVPLLLGIVIVSTIFVFCGNTIADLLYKYVDPRMRSVEDE
jgi:peptide/nickel transport system permease protein